jgi:hypothetical protein
VLVHSVGSIFYWYSSKIGLQALSLGNKVL